MAMTIVSALIEGEQLKTLSDSWRLDTEILLADAMSCQREILFSWPERQLTAAQQDKFLNYLQRRKLTEPIAYIIGRKAFWDFELMVTPDVLIPRPETELIVETALELLTDIDAPVRIADLGTGSGAIALALAKQSQSWRITATDSSEAALSVAKQNLIQLQLANVELNLACWCEGLASRHFDLIVSNPPYVATDDQHLNELRFEPQGALVAGDNGLRDIRQIISTSTLPLKKNAWLLIEHGYDQAASVAEIFCANGFKNINCRQDLAGLDRMSMAQIR